MTTTTTTTIPDGNQIEEKNFFFKDKRVDNKKKERENNHHKARERDSINKKNFIIPCFFFVFGFLRFHFRMLFRIVWEKKIIKNSYRTLKWKQNSIEIIIEIMDVWRLQFNRNGTTFFLFLLLLLSTFAIDKYDEIFHLEFRWYRWFNENSKKFFFSKWPRIFELFTVLSIYHLQTTKKNKWKFQYVWINRISRQFAYWKTKQKIILTIQAWK